MKIKSINCYPLLINNKYPYYWSHGIINSTEIILIEIEAENGVKGYGESIATPSGEGVKAFIDSASSVLIGEDIFQNQRIIKKCYHSLFQAHGTCSAPRFGAQILSGLEMALWDLCGKIVERPLHELLGGKYRDKIEYFGFIQGNSADELAIDAKKLSKNGHKVIYGKIGREESTDVQIVKKVREAVGKDIRLRFDPNEAWDLVTAKRMIEKLEDFSIEMIEQPCNHMNISVLKQIKDLNKVSIGVDQSVFNLNDLFQIALLNAADLVVLGLHETGGIGGLKKAAAVAESAGLNICIHGLHETGITTCAANQVAATIPNLDDGNQFMNHLIESDIINSPDLTLQNGGLPVLDGPGLGFEINFEAVQEAKEKYKIRNNQKK
jgi:muconate cycloisomerase|tara:strand:- start:1825 stop:2964 length:1140 start_codon:yes stop_codon:yes gene_type:complete